MTSTVTVSAHPANPYKGVKVVKTRAYGARGVDCETYHLTDGAQMTFTIHGDQTLTIEETQTVVVNK